MGETTGGQPPGVMRIFGTCSEHGEYELPAAMVESGEIERDCPACAYEKSERVPVFPQPHERSSPLLPNERKGE